MPLERISQGFKDISMTFQSTSSDKMILLHLKMNNAIARSIKKYRIYYLLVKNFSMKLLDPDISRSLYLIMSMILSALIDYR